MAGGGVRVSSGKRRGSGKPDPRHIDIEPDRLIAEATLKLAVESAFV